MKKAGFFGLLMFSLVSYIFTQTPQLTVAVSPFQARSGHTVEEAEIVTEIFTTQLVSSGAAKVVDRNSFDKIMTEMQFQASDWADNNKVARLGAAMNADSIITGQVMKLGNMTIITANLLDIKTAQILSSSRMQMNSIDQVFNQMPGFVDAMVKNLPVPNYLIGVWRVMNSDTILEFRSDGSYSVKNHTFYHDITWWDNSHANHISNITISGTYRYTRDTLEVLYTQRSNTTSKVYNAANKLDSASSGTSSGTEEKKETFRYSIDPVRNTLKINNFLLRNENAVRGDASRTYISDFIRQ
jgi:TolB-like protein